MKATRDWFIARYVRLTVHGRDRGVTSIEYAGIVILVAAIILAITRLNLGTAISGGISDAVHDIL